MCCYVNENFYPGKTTEHFNWPCSVYLHFTEKEQTERVWDNICLLFTTPAQVWVGYTAVQGLAYSTTLALAPIKWQSFHIAYSILQ